MYTQENPTKLGNTDQQRRQYAKPAVEVKELSAVVRGGPVSGGTDFQSRRFG